MRRSRPRWGLRRRIYGAEKTRRLAAHAVGAQFENLLRDAGKPLMGAATGVMNWLAGVEAGLGRIAEEYPAATTTAGLATAAAGFWGSLKLAQAAMMKAAGWWGQGAGNGAGPASPVGTGAEGASGAAESAAKAAPKVGTLGDFAKGFKDAVGGEEAMATLGRNASWALGSGVVAGLVSMAAQWGLNKGEEKLLGWTPENTAKAEGNIHAKAKEWFDSLFAGTAEAAKGLEETKQKATDAGEAIKAGLDVSVTPKVDLSHFDALDARIAKSTADLQKLGSLAASVPGQATQSIRRGYSPGTHALHDGSELY